MNYTKINNLTGWICFLIASVVYILTLEPTASFWDCGEFISAAFKLQVVHQPGAPLFLMIGKIFSLFSMGDNTRVAYWVNISSALASSTTILFMFWTITALARKVIWKKGEDLTSAKLIAIMGAGLVGALAYTFSDSFWFSAVEAEVYAMSSLCTAIVFWAILKWETHADEPYADRWIIFIAYVMGLSIGVHLLNLLAIPAIALVYYFKRTKNPTSRGTLLSVGIGIFILGFIQYGVIQYVLKFAAYFDLFFVNTLGLGFGSGVIFFALLVIGGIIYAMQYSIKKAKPVLNLALLSLVFVLFGYSSYAMIVIRAKANTSLNNSNPGDVFSLLSYLNREQYGDRPLAYGPYFDSKAIDNKMGGNIYRKGEEKYEVAGKKFDRIFDRNTILPRMYSQDASHVGYYRDWMGMSETQSPSFIENIGFLFSYQTGFMYMRYFLWNFVGRQNDVQGHGNYTDGNWISGIKFIDNLHVGGQNALTPTIDNNKATNAFYFLPLILGLIGAYWHFKRNQKDAGIVGLLFFFMGIAILLYLNQTPLQPRERDYAYTGSFYAFAIWIGLGVAGIIEFLQKKLTPKTAALLATGIGLLAAPVLMAKGGWDDHNRSAKTTARDFAKDYLSSCAPNAILFTYGDNDTYPLWYVQEVENFRPDVRIVNLSLLGTDWYINQMTKNINSSAPLPITMPNSKYVQGVRDVLYYNDYQLEGSIELKNLFEVMTSDNEADKITFQDGSKENFLPTKNLKMTVDANQVIATKTMAEKNRSQIVPVMEWKYNSNYVTKTELAMFDILAHNNWKRPVYFAITVPSSNYIGLDKYLYTEGFAYRLQPKLKAPEDSTANNVNTDEMYDNLMNKFTWGNIKNASYLDPESTRMIAVIVNNFNILAENLYKEGKTAKAKAAIYKCLEVIPEQNSSLSYTIRKIYITEMLYRLHDSKRANKVVESTVNYINDELNYLHAIAETKENLNSSDIQLGMSILNEFTRITTEYKQTALTNKIQGKFKVLESKFVGMGK